MLAAIYVRCSTAEQTPENQIEPCKKLAENRGYEVLNTYIELISGYKQVARPSYEAVKELARKGEIQAIIVWSLDRWVRSRDTLISDISLLKQYGCKLHSVQEAWLEAVNLEGPLGTTIQSFLLGLVGSLAQLESQRKSERVKLAYQAHTGKKWGRPGLSEGVKARVLRLHAEGQSMRRISQIVTYWDRNNNRQKLSLGAVHKIITLSSATKP